MDFHKIPSEKLRDQIFVVLLEKGVIKEGLDIDELKTMVPFDNMDNPASDSSEDESEPNVNEEVFSDSIPDTKSKSKEKQKKIKKEKKEVDPDKPKKAPNAYLVFKSHPDNKEAIAEKALEINGETGEPWGKVKAAGIMWKELTDEQREQWKK